MSLRRRVWAAAEQFCSRVASVVPIFLSHPSDPDARERGLDAVSHGAKLKLITLVLSLQADSLEEAEALIAAHRESEDDPCGVEVYRRGDGGDEPMASWHPEDPAWLQSLTDDNFG